jgi:hypothetical protein
MTTFEKHYIGKGTQVANLDIVKVVLPVEGLQAATFEKDGIKYLSFEIAKMKSPDKFGRTHTCYFQTKVYTEDAQTPEHEKQPKVKKPSKKIKPVEENEDDLPF